MEDCYLDDCKKKEWLRLRKLRLLQVRDLSKDIAEEVRKRARENQMKKSSELKAQKERIFQECKKMKCEELERKYYEAMEKMGLAHAVANAEPDADEVLEERQAKNDQRALMRGKTAEQKRVVMERELKEKENAPIRRKELTRRVEDIRAGLVVQCRDWTVINEANRQRQVLLDIPVTNVNDFQPREMKEDVPVARKTSTPSPKRAILKSPRSVKSPRAGQPYSLPGNKTPRSPVMPRLDVNLPSCRSTNEKSPERPLLEFYNRSCCGATYRVDPPRATKELIPSSDDEELSTLLKKYTSLKPSVTPPRSERQQQLTERRFVTPPTKEHDYSTKEPVKRKNVEKNKKGSRNETKKLFRAIDKALEEGRALQEEVSRNGSSVQDSESDDEAVVQLIVNVNCGQKCGEERCSEIKSVPSNDQSCQVVEKINVGTEVGQSLDEGDKPMRRKEESKRKKVRKCRHVPVRSSTVEDLSKDNAEFVDVSAITDVGQPVGSSSAWSSTVYLNSPEKRRRDEVDSFQVNPFLDYYIRKLLDMPPDPCESSVCTDCRCSASASVLSPEVSVSNTAKSQAFSVGLDLDEESDRRLKKIGELKNILKQIRKEQEVLQFSSTTASPGSSENRIAHESSDMSSSESKESTIRETVASGSQPVRKGPEPELQRQLSTITEVDSRLQLSDPPDIMEELLRRNIISKPFDWMHGKSLSELDDKDKSDGAFGFTNLSMSTASSYHPHVTQIGDDWVPNDGTDIRVESSSESSFELKDL